MSRHRSPGGRRAQRDLVPAPAGVPVAVASRSGARRPGGRRHAVAAAAVTGGTLAVTVPLAALLGQDVPAEPAVAALQLSANGTAVDQVVAPARTSARYMVVPVADGPDTGRAVDAAGLIKAAGLADVAHRADAARARVSCAVDVSGLGRVKPWVAAAARFLSCLYDEPDLIGVAGRGRVSDHPMGLALDLMTRGAEGDRIAACALRNKDALGISYVIWKQRINYGSGWEPMANRGSATENHMDHVHISFERSAPGGTPDPSHCS